MTWKSAPIHHRPRIDSRYHHRCRTRIDILVQISHNVRIGRCCVIVAQVGAADSTILEDFVQIGAQAGVIARVPAGAMPLGNPAVPRKEFFRQLATVKRLTCRPR